MKIGKKSIVSLLVGLAVAMTVFDGYYITDTGYQTIGKRAGKVVTQVDPGFHFKVPFIDTVVHVDIRERKSTETMAVATSEQMKASAIVSLNWAVQKSAVSELYSDYGSLEQFESKVLDPRLKEASKLGIAKFTAEENITRRDEVRVAIEEAFREKVKAFPIEVTSVQIEEISLPEQYLKSIDAKQTAKNERDAENYKLEKENLIAQRSVGVAKAKAEAIELEAAANAKGIELVGEAKARAIKAQAAALGQSPEYIELVKAERWNGSYITTGVGSGSSIIVDSRAATAVTK